MPHLALADCNRYEALSVSVMCFLRQDNSSAGYQVDRWWPLAQQLVGLAITVNALLLTQQPDHRA
jgi:hypothetical protein